MAAERPKRSQLHGLHWSCIRVGKAQVAMIMHGPRRRSLSARQERVIEHRF